MTDTSSGEHADPSAARGTDLDAEERAAQSAEQSAERREVIKKRVVDAVAVFLLSTVAVLTAWCGFQSSKWGGEMSIAFSQASSARVQATNFASEARDARGSDQSIWVQWVLATAQSDAELASYIEERFSPEFRVAFDEWDAGGREAQGPFVLESYVPPGTEEAADYNARADAKFQAALDNNQRGDNYSILTVLFALVLFLTAMSQRELQPWVVRTLLGLAIVATVAGLVILLTYPVRL
ncbi:hypothetical protein BJ978_001194 [Agromyces terreus]|uniref:Uncharacterized protein n=1 Tax=Agromyces terreus TaxID=424795 RepID=A0A9X2H0U2_9MICO|nr:hypothetical protein [Agromyces terreus]MCP2370518.1 hypothetical protein [Agromyces terreus]